MWLMTSLTTIYIIVNNGVGGGACGALLVTLCVVVCVYLAMLSVDVIC